tara:strand:- start:964 stop:1947 length:984 start_codon:yes stop_codon:yes gene_type:complete
MSVNIFFKNKGPFLLADIIKNISLEVKIEKNIKKLIKNFTSLNDATSEDITFFHSNKYLHHAKSTKACACITKKEFSKYLPNNCSAITTDNVLFYSSKVAELFYPSSSVDIPNDHLKPIDQLYSGNVGKNSFVGSDVTIGDGTIFGSNTIIEDNVVIGKNCIIGSNVVIKNSIVESNVHILDNATIGKKGFGFMPSKNLNYRYPHIGYVLIKNNCEIGAGSTIDRGSFSVTIIGENTFLDNQVHIAHNVKIGKNCIIAGQVGIAGSTILGDNVMIGGQAGISGHLKIGNNVQIGGGSGVIKNLSDNSRVMGYPAKDIKKFIKENKKI